jgi:hypothetical protein
MLAARSIVPISRLGTQAMAARVVHALAADGVLGRNAGVAQGPGFARAIANVIEPMLKLTDSRAAPDRHVNL